MRPGFRQRQKGISAIELMVGMLLGLILISGAIAIFLASKRSYTEVEQVSALSENAQFAQRLLNNALLHVGFFGEVQSNRIELDENLSAVVADCTGAAAAYDLQNYIFAAVADGSGSALGCIDDAVPGSHVLVVKSVIPSPLTDGPRENPDVTDPLQIDGKIDTPTELQDEQTYVMTNDTMGIMFDGADTQPNIKTGGAVPGGVAWVYQYEVFYVRAGTIPQLSRKVLKYDAGSMKMETENLVEGVEDLRLRFGLDGAGSADGEVDTYTSVAGMSGNWDQVESVEVSLLVRSTNQDPSYTNTKSYSMGGATITPTPADHFRRVLITISMSLRNPKLLIRGHAA